MLKNLESMDEKMINAAQEASKIAYQLYLGYFSHSAAIYIAKKPKEDIFFDNFPFTLRVQRKDKSFHEFLFKHYLDQLQFDSQISDEADRIWITGSLLRLGDVLSKNDYFDKAPVLMMIYHLRNGIAHGNKFDIRNTRLGKYPAHNKEAAFRNDHKTIFEITTELNGKELLFDFINAGDVLDILLSVSDYLKHLGEKKTPFVYSAID